MDLKGSLVDTNLRIYPTTKLIEFLQNIDQNKHKDLPSNIKKVIGDEAKNSQNSTSSEDAKTLNVHLSNDDIKKLQNIKEHLKENNKNTLNEKSIFETEINADDKETLSESDYESSKIESSSSDDDDDLDFSKDSELKGEKEEKPQKQKKNKLNKPKKPEKPFLLTSDIVWLYTFVHHKLNNGEKDIPYLHSLLEGCSIKLPKNKLIKRNPELEARCVKLRSQQDARDYRKMTKGVDNVRIRYPEDSIAYQLKSMNRQLIAIGQFILSIFAGFLFGFRGVEWMVGNLDFGFRLLLGVMCALIIALAEIYFLAKKLNEELQMAETVQIGGPVKFADPPLRKFHDPKELEKVLKEHEE